MGRRILEIIRNDKDERNGILQRSCIWNSNDIVLQYKSQNLVLLDYDSTLVGFQNNPRTQNPMKS
jgi:hypothetical protein